MKSALYVFSLLSLASGVVLLWISFGSERMVYALFFFLMGIGAIWAAIKYTVGKSAYGYQGLGDIFVFLFFGWVSVVGVYFLQVQSIDLTIFLPASCIGLLSAGVLNLNNTRDIENDKNSNKITLAVRLGFKNAKRYQAVLFLVVILCSVFYTYGSSWTQQLYWISFLPLTMVIIKTLKTTTPKDLDPLLKIQALSTLLYALTFGMGQVL
jgi:1,4-dihydroxy-2-naphthoate octaprenyltransferase